MIHNKWTRALKGMEAEELQSQWPVEGITSASLQAYIVYSTEQINKNIRQLKEFLKKPGFVQCFDTKGGYSVRHEPSILRPVSPRTHSVAELPLFFSSGNRFSVFPCILAPILNIRCILAKADRAHSPIYLSIRVYPYYHSQDVLSRIACHGFRVMLVLSRISCHVYYFPRIICRHPALFVPSCNYECICAMLAFDLYLVCNYITSLSYSTCLLAIQYARMPSLPPYPIHQRLVLHPWKCKSENIV